MASPSRRHAATAAAAAGFGIAAAIGIGAAAHAQVAERGSVTVMRGAETERVTLGGGPAVVRGEPAADRRAGAAGLISTYAPSTYAPSTYAPSTYAPSTYAPPRLWFAGGETAWFYEPAAGRLTACEIRETDRFARRTIECWGRTID